LFGISHISGAAILGLQHKDNQHPAIYTKMMVGHTCFWKIVVRRLLTMHLRLSTSNYVWQEKSSNFAENKCETHGNNEKITNFAEKDITTKTA